MLILPVSSSTTDDGGVGVPVPTESSENKQTKNILVLHSKRYSILNCLPSVGFRSWCRFYVWMSHLSPADDVSHKHDGRLPLPATLQRPATTFAAWWTEAQWVWTVCLRLLPVRVATAIWNPGRMLTIRLKCYNLRVLTIHISKYEEWS